jgi:hypothetical protein
MPMKSYKNLKLKASLLDLYRNYKPIIPEKLKI